MYAIESCSRCAIAHAWVCPTSLATLCRVVCRASDRTI